MSTPQGLQVHGLIDLASANSGGQAVFSNDDFFAPKDNLLKPEPAVFIADKYTEYGKWMDGWESRRKRGRGHDFCIVRLGCPGAVRLFDIDTSHFLGNHPPHASVDAVVARADASVDELKSADWQPLLKPVPLRPGSQNLFVVDRPKPYTHLRLNIFPDGGVARFRCWGIVDPTMVQWRPDELAARQLNKGEVDLAALVRGGRVVAANDSFFGPMSNLILPGRAPTMGDGWETRRKRVPGFDWIVCELAQAGRVELLEIDTNHFKGNYPDHARLLGLYAPGAELFDLLDPSTEWTPVLPDQKLAAHDRRFCRQELVAHGPFTHVRLEIVPDGGVSRLRVYGHPTDHGAGT